MIYFYKKDGEIFIPEKINPDLVKLAFAVVKSCKLNFPIGKNELKIFLYT